jgi:hypothetical protein
VVLFWSPKVKGESGDDFEILILGILLDRLENCNKAVPFLRSFTMWYGEKVGHPGAMNDDVLYGVEEMSIIATHFFESGIDTPHGWMLPGT